MNKKFLSLAVAAAMAAPMAAQAQDVTLYGKAHVSLSNFSNGTGINGGNDYWDLNSNESRLGVKGSEDLGNGMKAIFKMEFQVRMADTNNVINDGETNQMTGRNMYVGLAGDWGTFLAGRHDVPLKISTASLDLFDGTIADYNNIATDGDDQGIGTTAAAARSLEFMNVRADSAIAYVSPNMNGLTVAAAIVPGGNSSVVGVDTTNLNPSDGLADAISVAAIYSNGPFFASLATTQYDSDLIVQPGTLNNAGLDVWRLGLGYTANNFHVGFVYEDVDSENGLNTTFPASTFSDHNVWQLSGSYTFGNNVAKVMYGERDSKNATAADIDQWAVGLDHNLSKRTKVYAVYTDVSSSLANMDWSGFSAGMETNF
jgi:predicted porin